MSKRSLSRATSDWKIFHPSPQAYEEYKNKFASITVDTLSSLSVAETATGVLFGFIPPSELYENANCKFGLHIASSEDNSDFGVYKELLETELEEPDVRSLASAVWYCRTEYHGPAVGLAETKLLRMSMEEYLKAKLTEAIENQNLVDLYQTLCYGEQLDICSDSLSEARAQMARLEQIAHQLSEKSKPEHSKKYSTVIGELSEKLFGRDVVALQGESGDIIERVLKNTKEQYELSVVLQEELNRLKAMPSSAKKAKGLEETVEKIKELDLVSAKEMLSHARMEQKTKLRQIVTLTSQYKRLQRDYASLTTKHNDQADEMLTLLQAHEDQSNQLAELQTKANTLEHEKEQIREDTMEFAANYLKEEYNKKMAIKIEEKSREFGEKLDQALEKEKSTMKARFDEQLAVKDNEISGLTKELNDLKSLVSRQTTEINNLKASEAKLKARLSENKLKKMLG